MKRVNESYEIAEEIYAAYGVDTDEIQNKLDKIQISLHCWQGDDVIGFETGAGKLSNGGILTTGSYPGRARNGEELREDIEKALSLIPGRHRINLHAIYAETGDSFVDRDKLSTEHFKDWVNWAKSRELGLDFNPSFFSHEKASSGYTLSSEDESIRRFWVEHGKRSREIAADMGRELGTPCVNNIWIPDGSKDVPADRMKNREILKESLDEILAEKFDPGYLVDAVESKLFGIGSEAYVVGSHEFYMGYAANKDVIICLDTGHFHPTEAISDKVSSILAFSKAVLIHASRGIRWDSDHVAILNDDIVALSQEVKRCNAFDRTYFALDFFDASINRVAAWVIGARAVLKSILFALLEPTEMLIEAEASGDFGKRLALMEEFKTLPFGAVWNKYCLDKGIPVGSDWIESAEKYQREVSLKRI